MPFPPPDDPFGRDSASSRPRRPRRAWRWRRRLAWLGTMACLAIMLPDYISTQRSPAGGPDDADLHVESVVIAQPHDGLHHLRTAVASLALEEVDRLAINRHLDRQLAAPGAVTPDELDALHEILQRNVAALAGLRASLDAPHFLLPEMNADEFEFTPEIPLETEQLVDLLRLRALLRARAGEWDSAFESAVDILRLAQRLEGASRAVLTTTMMSVGYRSDALETLRRLVTLAPLDNDQARRWAATLLPYRSDPAAWKRMWAVEYQQWKSLLGWIGQRAQEESRIGSDRLTQAEISRADLQALRLETERTLEVFAELTRSYQRVSESNCEALGEMRFPQQAPENDPMPESDLALEINAPDYRDFFLRRCAEDTALAATRTLIALRAFQHDHGSLPDALGELVPTYLDAIPKDTFRGEPLRYSKAERFVYSLGTTGLETPAGGPMAAYEAFRELRYPIEF